MGDTYAESAFQSRHSVGIVVLKTVIVLVTVVLIMLIVFSQVTGLAFVGGMVVLVEYYGFSRMKAEYEIIYCDGQLDFDKISGTLGRRTMFQLDLSNVEMIAPYEDEALRQYRNVPVKKKFIPGRPEDSYVIVTGDAQGELRKVLFYPTEKMLDCIAAKMPSRLKRRVVEELL